MERNFKELNKATAEAFLSNATVYDNHRSGGSKESENAVEKNIIGLVKLNDDNRYLCGYFRDARYFSLNPIVAAETGNLHIKTWSIAGTVVCAGDVLENIDNYNKSCAYSRMKIVRVIMKDGSIINASEKYLHDCDVFAAM